MIGWLILRALARQSRRRPEPPPRRPETGPAMVLFAAIGILTTVLILIARAA